MNEAGELDGWWLRSPGFDNSMAAFIEEDGGGVYEGDPVNTKGTAVRPAFNLNLSSVLFTSAATDGKPTGTGLTAVANYSGNEWKLTLLDGSRGFDIADVAWSGNTLTFSYSRARTGTNEYISAIIEENGAITYYGRILQLTSESGTASLSLPSGVTLSDTTKLHVFNEQVNGDKRTDYASGLSGVPAPEKPAITTTNLVRAARWARHTARPSRQRVLRPSPGASKAQPARRLDPLRQYHLGNADNRRDVHLHRKGRQTALATIRRS